jgi:hypothetical protein
VAAVHDYSVSVRGYLGAMSLMRKEQELGMSERKGKASSQVRCHAQGWVETVTVDV